MRKKRKEYIPVKYLIRCCLLSFQVFRELIFLKDTFPFSQIKLTPSFRGSFILSCNKWESFPNEFSFWYFTFLFWNGGIINVFLHKLSNNIFFTFKSLITPKYKLSTYYLKCGVVFATFLLLKGLYYKKLCLMFNLLTGEYLY